MSEIRESTSVKRLRNGKAVSIYLACTTGDAYQEYKGKDSSGNDVCSPDWTKDENRPTFFPSIAAGGVTVIPTDDKWWYNVIQLVFGADNLSTNSGLAGTFKRVTHNSVPALKIMKNLASESNQDSDTIKFNGAIKVGGIDDRIEKTEKITITRKGEATYKGIVMGIDNDGMVINAAGGSTRVYAKLLGGGEAIDNSKYIVEFKKQLNGAFVDITKADGSKLTDTSDHVVTITADMVNAFLNLYAIFKDATTLAELTSDVGTVQDTSDPLRIDKNAVPADETIVNDSDTVVYTPSVVDSSGNVRSEFANKFKFFLSNEDGKKIVGDYDHSAMATASQTITANDVDKAAPGNLMVEIVGDDTY